MPEQVPLTDEEIEAQAKEKCRHCANGSKVRRRPATGEWVHDFVNAENRINGHTLCLASAFRNEQRAA